MISIIVPVYCGSKTLPDLMQRINQVMNRAYKQHGYEIILVDDNSPDNSFDVIKNLASTYVNIRGIRLSRNFGQQNATYCGLHYATGDVVITMDDDLQHEPELLPGLIRKLNGDLDLVYGVFVERQDGEYRRLGSKLTGGFFRRSYPVLKGCRVSSFRVFTGNLKNKIIGKEYGFVYLSCLLLDECSGVDNVRIPFTPRVEGRSNYNFMKLFKLYLRLQLNYGVLGKMYKNTLKTKEPCFEVRETVESIRFSRQSSENLQQGVSENEGHDAGWRHKSAVCN